MGGAGSVRRFRVLGVVVGALHAGAEFKTLGFNDVWIQGIVGFRIQGTSNSKDECQKAPMHLPAWGLRVKVELGRFQFNS